METRAPTPQFQQKRKFLLVLPLLVLPFITLLFWAMGGGRVSDVQAQPLAKGGLNVELPDAKLKDDKGLNKLSYYEKAASDSAKIDELMKNDPYYHQQQQAGIDALNINKDTILQSPLYKQNLTKERNSLATSPYSNYDSSDPNEAKVYKKLNELNAALKQATIPSGKTSHYSDVAHYNNVVVKPADVDRLEQMTDGTNSSKDSEDPEMKQLNGMMEKILDIQHPERVQEKIKQTSEANRGQVFAVTANSNNDNTSLLVNDKGTSLGDSHRPNEVSGNGFFSLDDGIETDTEQQNAIQAVIHETQTLVEGAIVKLRLVNDISVNGILIPKGNFVFGIASLNGERLNIKINSIRYQNFLFPVQLSVVDMDGIEGIYIPGAITRDVAKQSAEQAVQGIGLKALDPSLGAQAASAGIEAAKTMLSRKAKLVKVTVKAGYQVLLQDGKQKSSF